eukprot:3501596-Amphidinium_carterae.1
MTYAWLAFLHGCSMTTGACPLCLEALDLRLHLEREHIVAFRSYFVPVVADSCSLRVAAPRHATNHHQRREHCTVDWTSTHTTASPNRKEQ